MKVQWLYSELPLDVWAPFLISKGKSKVLSSSSILSSAQLSGTPPALLLMLHQSSRWSSFSLTCEQDPKILEFLLSTERKQSTVFQRRAVASDLEVLILFPTASPLPVFTRGHSPTNPAKPFWGPKTRYPSLPKMSLEILSMKSTRIWTHLILYRWTRMAHSNNPGTPYSCTAVSLFRVHKTHLDVEHGVCHTHSMTVTQIYNNHSLAVTPQCLGSIRSRAPLYYYLVHKQKTHIVRVLLSATCTRTEVTL